jgi:ankyrin repeat protein
MKKNLILISASLLVSSHTFSMDETSQTNKKAKVAETTSKPTEPFPKWKYEIDKAIQAGDLEKFSDLVTKHDIKDQTFISSLPGLALIALSPKKETRIALATILLANGAKVDQTSACPVAGSTTPLGWACVQGDNGLADLFIARGARILRSNNVGRQPLTQTILYHPENEALIKTVMRAAHAQHTLSAVVQNTQSYFDKHHPAKYGEITNHKEN